MKEDKEEEEEFSEEGQWKYGELWAQEPVATVRHHLTVDVGNLVQLQISGAVGSFAESLGYKRYGQKAAACAGFRFSGLA